MADALEAGKAFLDIVPRTGAAFEAELQGQVGGSLSKISSIGAAAGKALTVGLAGAAIAVGPALFEIGSKWDEAFDKIRTDTGKTGDALKGLEDSTKDILGDVPTNIGAAGDAVAGLNQRLGLTGQPLRDVGDRLLELSRMTKTDLNVNLEATAGLFNSWGIAAADQGPRLDELFRASQATGVGVSDLASAMASAGPLLRTTGLNFEQSAALVGLLGKAGVSTTSIMAPLSKAIATAAKEGKSAGDVLRGTFDAIRNAPNDTAAAGAAIDVFGARAGPKLAGLIREGKLSYDDLAKTIATGSDTILGASADTQDFGEKMRLAWNKVLVAVEPVALKVFNFVGELAGKAGPALTVLFAKIGEAWAAAVEEFNSPGVQAFIASFRENLLPILKQVADFVEQHAKPILIGLGVAIAALVAPVASAVAALIFLYVRFSGVRTAVAAAIAAVRSFVTFVERDVAPVVKRIVDYIVGQFEHLIAAVRTRWSAISEAVRHVLTALKIEIALFLGPLVIIWRAAHDQIMSIVRVVWDQIRSTVETAVRMVRDIIDIVLDLINGDWGKAWAAVKDLLGAAWDWITSTVGNALSVLVSLLSGALATLGSLWSSAWSVARSVVGAAWDWIKGAVSSGADAIVGFVASLPGRIASAASGMWNGILSAFKSAINGVISIWNNLSFPSFTFHIPHVPGTSIGGDITIGGWQLPNIPYVARGGDVTGSGYAVVGEKGPELMKLPSGASIIPLDTAKMIADAKRSTDRPLTGDVYLDGRKVGRAQFTTTRAVERAKR